MKSQVSDSICLTKCSSFRFRQICKQHLITFNLQTTLNKIVIFFVAETVAQFKFTVLLMPSGINLVTGIPFDATHYETDNSILDAEMKELVLSEIPNKSARHKAKKAAKGAATNTTTPADVKDAKDVKDTKDAKDAKDETKAAK